MDSFDKVIIFIVIFSFFFVELVEVVYGEFGL